MCECVSVRVCVILLVLTTSLAARDALEGKYRPVVLDSIPSRCCFELDLTKRRRLESKHLNPTVRWVPTKNPFLKSCLFFINPLGLKEECDEKIVDSANVCIRTNEPEVCTVVACSIFIPT